MYKDLIGCNIKPLRGANQKVRQKNKFWKQSLTTFGNR